MTVAMNLATIQHHSYLKSGVVNVGVQVGTPLAPVTEYVAPAQVPPVFSTTTVTTDLVYPQFSSTAVVPSAPCVVGSLPPVEEFTGPVYDQVLQEHIAASEFTEKFAEFPVVQEQVIVQEIPGVVAPLPPIEEFAGPVYNLLHQEQFAAGVTLENLVGFPVVQEQVLVQTIPEVVDSLPPVQQFTGSGFFHVHHEHIAAVPAVTEFFPLSDERGSRPPCLGEPRRPQEQVQRHTMEQLADVAPMVPSLAVPEPQMVDQLVAMVKHVDSAVPEQIIAVLTISWPSRFPRTVLCEPQKAEQLVEVPVPAPLLQRLGSLGGDLQAHGSYVAWWLRMAPAPFEGNHRQPRAVYKYWARTSSTPLVPRSLCSSSSTEWWQSVVAAVFNSCAQCKLCSFGEFGVNCSDKFQQFLVGCERPCDPRCSVRQWIQILRQLGILLEEFLDFYVNGYTRLLRSILVLLFPVNEVAALVVDTGSGLFSTGFAGKNAPRAVFRTIAFTQNGEVCTVFCFDRLFSLDIISPNPLFCSIFSCAQSPLVDFLGALDDEEFFVVEGSGVAGSPGVSTPR